MPDLLTIEEASRRIGVSDKTLRRMIRTGEFPEPIRRNRRWVRIPEADVIEYQNKLLTRQHVHTA